VPLAAPVILCIVCHREGARRVCLPSGVPAPLCRDCEGNRFMVDEAERRAQALAVRP
jgi:hypothetical protein